VDSSEGLVDLFALFDIEMLGLGFEDLTHRLL
jgi:hypothetical protein